MGAQVGAGSGPEPADAVNGPEAATPRRRGLGRGLGAILPARTPAPVRFLDTDGSHVDSDWLPGDKGEPAWAGTSAHGPGELLAQLDRALEGASATRSTLAVVVLGVDGFRHVNTAFGRRVGDAFLEGIEDRLVRSHGRRGDVVGRIRGDQFVVACPHLDGPLGARRFLERVAADFETPISAAGVEHSLRATLGLVLLAPDRPDDADVTDSDDAGMSAEVLLGCAEMARWRAKDAGLRLAVFTPERDVHQPPRWKTSLSSRRDRVADADGRSSSPGSPRSTAPR